MTLEKLLTRVQRSPEKLLTFSKKFERNGSPGPYTRAKVLYRPGRELVVLVDCLSGAAIAKSKVVTRRDGSKVEVPVKSENHKREIFQCLDRTLRHGLEPLPDPSSNRPDLANLEPGDLLRIKDGSGKYWSGTRQVAFAGWTATGLLRISEREGDRKVRRKAPSHVVGVDKKAAARRDAAPIVVKMAPSVCFKLRQEGRRDEIDGEEHNFKDLEELFSKWTKSPEGYLAADLTDFSSDPSGPYYLTSLAKAFELSKRFKTLKQKYLFEGGDASGKLAGLDVSKLKKGTPGGPL